jgi:hypothetical protein
MKNKNFPLIAASTIMLILATSNTAEAQKFIDVIGNPPYGSDPVNGVIGSGATPNKSTGAAFSKEVQSKVNAVSATFDVARISGSQSVNGNTIEVDPNAATAVLAVINSPANSNLPDDSTLINALGRSDAAGRLARSLQGLRNQDGSIDPIILTKAVDSYNSYIRSLIDSRQTTPLPPGQKATQVVLGKLLEAAR